MTIVRDVTEETRRMTRIFYDPHFLRCETLFDALHMLQYSVASHRGESVFILENENVLVQTFCTFSTHLNQPE